MSGITYYRLEQNTSDVPATSGATSHNRGFYGVPGTMEYLVIHLEQTLGGTVAQTTDATALVSQFRLILNGEVIYDWTAGVAPDAGSTLPGRFGYFINSIGGRCFQVPTSADATSVETWIGIPVGTILSNATPRFEITLGYYDANLVYGASATVDSSSVEYWARFNTNTQTSTRVLSATSFNHAANSLEQVVARVPQLAGGGNTVLGLFVQNQAEADNMGTQGIRSLALSQFGMPLSLQRWANGELNNGIASFLPGTSITAQTYSTERAGALLLPLFGLNAGDVTLLVDNGSDATVRLYHPVITAPLQGTKPKEPRQTIRAPGNTAQAVVRRTESQ